MVSYSPLKLTVEEEVPFTPPKSLQNTSMTSNGCEGSNETDCSSEDRAIQLDDHATISNKKVPSPDLIYAVTRPSMYIFRRPGGPVVVTVQGV